MGRFFRGRGLASIIPGVEAAFGAPSAVQPHLYNIRLISCFTAHRTRQGVYRFFVVAFASFCLVSTRDF